MPLPQAFFDDPAGFNEQPIGNGPFMMDGPWQHDTEIKTVRNPDYPLEPAKLDGLDFRIYADVNTAVTDLLAGNLDIVDAIPPERFTEVQGQIGEDHTGKSPSSSINYIGLPMYLPWLGENQPLRAALSLAIDNQQITDTIFEGLRQPAYDLFSPVIPGYKEKVCDNWGTDAAKAKQLFDEAGGLDALPDKLEFWFNEGAGHENWVDAVTTQWQNVLGIPKDQWEFKTMQFAQYLEVEDSKSFTGPFRLGWGMDYPHPQNYTVPLLLITPTDGGSNGTYYESQAFSDKLNEALQIADIQEAIPVFQDAMKIVCEDVPVIPMFYGQNTYGWSDNVQNLYVDAFSDINYLEVSAKS
jgi:ABC-type transport system substrate-binding protein